MVQALHSSGIEDGDRVVYGGEPCGFVITLEDGTRLYHAGDTAVHSDMALIAELYAPEIALLPIGDLYTMSPREAAVAARMLKPQAGSCRCTTARSPRSPARPRRCARSCAKPASRPR